jgi:D-xylose transport system permease protein
MRSLPTARPPELTEPTRRANRDRSGRRLGRPDLGQTPTIIVLAVIWILFQLADPNFLSPANLTNLLLQIAPIGILALGITLVLLLGEMDLSVSAVSGLSAAIMAVLSVKAGLPGPLAVLSGLATGLVIGVFQGWVITKLRVPSFVLTLAGFLAWQGVLLLVLGETGTVNLRDPFVVGLAGTFFPPLTGWLVAGLCVGLVGVAGLIGFRPRPDAGALEPTAVARLLLTGAAVLVAIVVLNADRGLPLAALLFVGLTAFFDALIRWTTWGRHVFAVGGNAAAARRASIGVDQVRISVFGICATLAAFGGILDGSRLLAVNQSSGSVDLLLTAIAAAVIGGTSLFGGRGSVWGALLGALMVGSISNGIDLLALPAEVKLMITGAVLFLAVTLDALTRRQHQTRRR